MRADFYPLQILLITVSGWVNRRQQDVIAYLVEENRVLKEQSKGLKLRLTGDQRRRLAAKAKRLARQSSPNLDSRISSGPGGMIRKGLPSRSSRRSGESQRFTSYRNTRIRLRSARCWKSSGLICSRPCWKDG